MGLDIFRCHITEVGERNLPNVKSNCNLSYLRSAYNDSGFNSVCRKRQLPDMYEIFGAAIEQGKPQSEYYIMLDRELIPKSLDLAMKTKAGFELDLKLDKYYHDIIDIIIAMLTEMHNTGYGLLLGWSS